MSGTPAGFDCVMVEIHTTCIRLPSSSQDPHSHILTPRPPFQDAYTHTQILTPRPPFQDAYTHSQILTPRPPFQDAYTHTQVLTPSAFIACTETWGYGSEGYAEYYTVQAKINEGGGQKDSAVSAALN